MSKLFISLSTVAPFPELVRPASSLGIYTLKLLPYKLIISSKPEEELCLNKVSSRYKTMVGFFTALTFHLGTDRKQHLEAGESVRNSTGWLRVNMGEHLWP